MKKVLTGLILIFVFIFIVFYWLGRTNNVNFLDLSDRVFQTRETNNAPFVDGVVTTAVVFFFIILSNNMMKRK